MIRNLVFVIASMVFVVAAFLPQAAHAQGNQNEVPLSSMYVNGAVGADTQGFLRTVHDPSLDPESNPFFQVDENGVPTQFDSFQLFPGAFLDTEVVANDQDSLTGILMLDKFAGVHTSRFLTPGDPEIPLSEADRGPRMDYSDNLAEFNANNPSSQVFFPYFPFNLPVPTATDGVARDLEVAVDWRNATNAFQGYYILDVFAAVHYVNNPEILSLMIRNPSPSGDGTYTEGMNKFRDIFGFRTQYLLDFAGRDQSGNTITRPAPYFRFAGGNGFPIARDLEVLTRYKKLDSNVIQESVNNSQQAENEGIDTSQIFTPIAMGFERLDRSNRKFADAVPITTGYAILDGFGSIHSMVEDEDGNVIPAPWEDVNGRTPDGPYFDPFDLAVDIELMANGGGVLLLNRIGEVFVINAQGKTDADNFAGGDSSILDDLPRFGFDAARDLTVVSNDEGKVQGVYVLDRFGTVHRAGNVPRLPGSTLYFLTGNSRSLEVSPISRPVTAPQALTASQ